jgi:hypothetical protein
MQGAKLELRRKPVPVKVQFNNAFEVMQFEPQTTISDVLKVLRSIFGLPVSLLYFTGTNV